MGSPTSSVGAFLLPRKLRNTAHHEYVNLLSRRRRPQPLETTPVPTVVADLDRVDVQQALRGRHEAEVDGVGCIEHKTSYRSTPPPQGSDKRETSVSHRLTGNLNERG